MDKFAVDIEKVLDEFEYNEGREETVRTVLIKDHSSLVSQTKIRPPAASYRRPAFEPINLADADFSAAPIPTTSNYTDIVKNNLRCNVPSLSQIFENERNPAEKHCEPVTQLISHGTDEINCINSLKDSNNISVVIKYDTYQSDDTPDLLDKTLIPIHGDSGSDDDDVSSQLPDLTSVINTVSADETSPVLDPVLDLIKPHVTISRGFEELPPIFNVNHCIKDKIPDLQVSPISFECVDDVTEAEVEEYLNNLETTEELNFGKDAPCGKEQTVNELDDEITGESVPRADVDVITELSSEDTEAMGLTGSSNKAANDIDQKQEPVNPSKEFDRLNDGKTSCIPDLPTENPFSFKKCDLDNINSRSCTNHSTTKRGIHGLVLNIEKADKCVEDNLNAKEPLISSTQQDEHNSSSDSLKNNFLEVGTVPFVKPVSSNGMPSQQNEDSCNESNVAFNTRDNVSSSITSDWIGSRDELSTPSTDLSFDSPDAEENPTESHDLTATENQGPASPPPTNGRPLNMMVENIGKFPPLWIPDTEADNCMQCQLKFTMIKRRHHCRACGLVLCSKCCNLKAPLEFLEFMEARVCQLCFNIIFRVSLEDERYNLGRQPNPNNPMEYCSTIPPLQQAASTLHQPPPSVLVPTGVLKREGKSKSEIPKQVIFSDGIRPGGDLTELDCPSESRIAHRKGVRRLTTQPPTLKHVRAARRQLDPKSRSFIPTDGGLPPPASYENGEYTFGEEVSEVSSEPVKFAINYNLFVSVKKIKLDCCVGRECWTACSEGLACVGQDEVAIVLEACPNENLPPLDIFNLINSLHLEASKGSTVTEMCFSPTFTPELFGSKDNGGFIYIRTTFQCTANLLLPAQPYLIAILVHRWETPWARLFPLRLVLRLGAEYRYYPCPLVSLRNRPPLYTDIGHTVMKILVDFRKYSYSLATVRGLLIHMEDRQTTILFPRNRYDQVVRALNNSNESVLAFGANLSLVADSHLVCIQGTKDENTYHTQAINIHNKPRRVTGASFVVFNGTLKTAGLSGKSSIMEDGLMVHLPSDGMVALRYALREMQNYVISCGPNDEETVVLEWTTDDVSFNIGVKSCIDGKPLDGVPSIRVHNGTDYPGSSKIIRWTEVFILQSEGGSKSTDPIDISRVSELLARATCVALVPELDSLAKANYKTIAIRANIHPEKVCYEAGSLFEKLPPKYMRRLDEELVPVVHQAALTSQETPVVLELIFRIMNHQ